MGFHGKDDWESIQRRQEWNITHPLRARIAELESRNDKLMASKRKLLAFVRYVLSEENKTTYPHPDFSRMARAILSSEGGK